MIHPNPNAAITAMLAGLLLCAVATANEHTTEALQHATEAVRAGTDAKVLGAQAAEALKHTEAAKADQTSHPELLKQLNEGENDLKSAVRNASQYNTEQAVRDAADAQTHLKAADTAARRLEATQPKPAWPIVR